MAYWVTTTGSYRPFNDNQFYYGKVYRPSVTGGLDTRDINNYREGINLRTLDDIFTSTQMKVSFADGNGDLTNRPNGTLTHEITFNVPGQAVSLVQYTNNNLLYDNIIGVEGTYLSGSTRLPKTVQYLIDSGRIADGTLSGSTVFPVYLNGGPQNEAEAIIELLPIPWRLPTNEPTRELSRGVYAELGAGTPGDERVYGLPQLEQRVSRYEPLVVRPYLEQGSHTLVVTSSVGSVIKVITSRLNAVPGPQFQQIIRPWLDEDDSAYLPKLVGAEDLLMLSASFSGTTGPYCNFGYQTIGTELQTRDMKSCAAGFSYYGPNASIYGTDSMAFGNRMRGS